MAGRQHQEVYVNQNRPGRAEEHVYEAYEAVEMVDLPVAAPPPSSDFLQQETAQPRKKMTEVKWLAIALAAIVVIFAGIFAVVFTMLMTSSGSADISTSSNQSATHAQFGGKATNMDTAKGNDAGNSKTITELKKIQEQMTQMQNKSQILGDELRNNRQKMTSVQKQNDEMNGTITKQQAEIFSLQQQNGDMNESFTRQQAAIRDKMVEMEQQLTVMNKTLDGFNIRQLLLGDRCKVEYQGKCFWAIKTTEIGTSALGRCKSFGGYGANIYDAVHFEMIRKYLVTISVNGDDFFTGMTYNRNNKILSFVNGTQSTFMDWYSGEPSTGTIMFDVGVISAPSDAGFWATSPNGGQEGVLCEI